MNDFLSFFTTVWLSISALFIPITRQSVHPSIPTSQPFSSRSLTSYAIDDLIPCPDGTLGIVQKTQKKITLPLVCRVMERFRYAEQEVVIYSAMYGQSGGDAPMPFNIYIQMTPGGGLKEVDPLLGIMTQSLTGAAGDKVRTALKGWGFTGTVNNPVIIKGLMVAPSENGPFCADFEVQAPASGTLTACDPSTTAAYGLITVKGNVQLPKSSMSEPEAVAKAHVVSDAPYLKKVHGRTKEPDPVTVDELTMDDSNYLVDHPDAFSLLTANTVNTKYFPNGDYWAIILSESIGYSDSHVDYYVLSRVNHDGTTCVVKTEAWDLSQMIHYATEASDLIGGDIPDSVTCPK